MTNNECIVIGETTYLRTDLETMSREQLRVIARLAHKERVSSVSLTWLGSAAKSSDLIAFIFNDASAEQFGFASLQNEPKPQAEHATKADNLAATLADALRGYLPNGHVNRDEVEAIVNDVSDRRQNELVYYVDRLNAELSEQIKNSARVVRFELGESRVIELSGLRHEAFDDLLADCLAFQASGQCAKANFFLVGPAGTGKTTAAEKLAEHLGLPFHFNGAIDSEYKLSGFIDAHGRIISTPFRKAYSQGGVYLFDEVDSSLPSACLAFNAALANGAYAFPGEDTLTARHKDCVIIASGNTWFGPDGNYVGRFRQDAAFLDRFIRVPWPIDEKFEAALCANKEWVAYVQARRAKAKAYGVEHLISPRASLSGDVLLAAGRPWNRVVELCVRKGLNDADWNKISQE